jgi:hypothetical protein
MLQKIKIYIEISFGFKNSFEAYIINPHGSRLPGYNAKIYECLVACINCIASRRHPGLPAGKVVKVYNGRGEVENRIKEGKNTRRWDKTSCQRFEANQARLKMGVLAYNLLHMIRQS